MSEELGLLDRPLFSFREMKEAIAGERIEILDQLLDGLENFNYEVQPKHDGDPKTWSNGFMDCYSRVQSLLKKLEAGG